MKLNKSMMLSLAILVVAVLWIASGFILKTEEAQSDGQANSHEETKLIQVTVQSMMAQSYTRRVTVNGVTQASRSVDIRAEEEGRIIALAREEGAKVAKNDPLARIEMQDRDERVGEAEALVKQREIEFKAAESLQKRGFNSQVRLAEAETALETARAELARAQESLENLIIQAPFDGVLSDQMIEVGDYVRIADPAFHIARLNPLEVRVFLNERDILALKKGKMGVVEFLDGRHEGAVVTHISPQADPDSRTFEVLLSMDNPERTYLDGLTARVSIPVEVVKAYKISPAILVLADDGTVGIRVADKDDHVAFLPVTIYADEPDGMWVGGLPDRLRVITVGQQFVSDGQAIDPVTQGAGE